MAGEVGGSVEARGAVVVVEDQQRVARRAHEGLHQLLVHELRAVEVDGVPFLARADVQQAQRLAARAMVGEFAGSDFNLPVLFVAGLDVRDDLGDGQRAVALAELAERLRRLEAAARTAAEVILAKERPPRAGKAASTSAMEVSRESEAVEITKADLATDGARMEHGFWNCRWRRERRQAGCAEPLSFTTHAALLGRARRRLRES